MSLTRSKSAPQVSVSITNQSTRHLTALSHACHPKIQRRASALVLSSLSLASPSGHQTQSPRIDRQDDPFSLAGFFPASLAGSARVEHMEWDWLHFDGVGPEGQTQKVTSGYTSPSSSEGEEGEWMPATPSPMFDHSEDEVCGETIKREDKLGVLSLPNPFLSLDVESALVQQSLISPYTEDSALDSDALYNALCALRKAHATSEMSSVGGCTSSGSLFSSVEEDEGIVDSDLETLGTRGLGRLLDMLPL